MSYLRAHPRRVVAAALSLVLISAAITAIILIRSGDDLPPVTQTDRNAAVASLSALQVANVPENARRGDAAVSAAAKYEWALARLSERARDRGIAPASAEDIARELKAVARACCDGNVDDVVRRARAAGVARADLERAVALRVDYGRLQHEMVKESDPAPPSAVAAEIQQWPGRYAREPKARPARLYMCMSRSCGEAVIAALDQKKTDAEIAKLIVGMDRRNGIVSDARIGPAGDFALWKASQKLSVGQWPRTPVQTELAPWVVPVPTGRYAAGRALSPEAQRHGADLAVRNAAASAMLRSQLDDLMRRAS